MITRPGNSNVALFLFASAGTKSKLVAIFEAKRVSDRTTLAISFSFFYRIMCILYDLDFTVDSFANVNEVSHLCWFCTRSERIVICNVVTESNNIRSVEFDLASFLPITACYFVCGLLFLALPGTFKSFFGELFPILYFLFLFFFSPFFDLIFSVVVVLKRSIGIERVKEAILNLMTGVGTRLTGIRKTYFWGSISHRFGI